MSGNELPWWRRLFSSHSIDIPAFLPDGAVDALPQAEPPRSTRMALVIFLGVFIVLQWAWGETRGSWLERLIVHQATVTPAAKLIRLATPEIPAQAVGASIKAPGGGLNILNGCEGTEVMFLLAAALLAVRMPWRQRLPALLLGVGLVFALNQARILTLFYAFRADRSLFDALHTAVLPVVLVAATAAYFYVALHYCQRRLA